MSPRPAPAFGKRNFRQAASVGPIPKAAPVPLGGPAAGPETTDHAAFFADLRGAGADSGDTPPLTVPRSLRAAILAGLVDGFCLAGLDITHGATMNPALEPLLKLGGLDGLANQALPYMIGLSLISGARVAATTLLIAHRALTWTGHSSHFAYALGGAVLTACYAGIVLAITKHPPQHGWALDIASGAGAGFFYRMFAGARRTAA